MADDLHTMSAPYALDALSPEDRERFEEHLADCERCRADLAALNDAAAALAFAVEGPGPPPTLRGRILEAARGEGPTNVVPLRARRPVVVPLAAAFAVAATAAAVALGVWAASLSHSLSHDRQALRVIGDPSARHYDVAGRGQLVVAQSGVAVLALHMPAPPKGKTYEAWVADPTVHRAGEFDGSTAMLPIRLTPGAKVMVTVERAGGVDAPTSKPLFVVTV